MILPIDDIYKVYGVPQDIAATIAATQPPAISNVAPSNTDLEALAVAGDSLKGVNVDSALTAQAQKQITQAKPYALALIAFIAIVLVISIFGGK